MEDLSNKAGTASTSVNQSSIKEESENILCLDHHKLRAADPCIMPEEDMATIDKIVIRRNFKKKCSKSINTATHYKMSAIAKGIPVDYPLFRRYYDPDFENKVWMKLDTVKKKHTPRHELLDPEKELPSNEMIEFLNPQIKKSDEGDYNCISKADEYINYKTKNKKRSVDITNLTDKLPKVVYDMSVFPRYNKDDIKHEILYSKLDMTKYSSLKSIKVYKKAFYETIAYDGFFKRFFRTFFVSTLMTNDNFLSYSDSLALFTYFKKICTKRDFRFFYRLYLRYTFYVR